MPEPKTKKTERSADSFFASIKDEQVRKDCKALYLMLGNNRQEHLLTKLGKHTSSKGCLYIKRLSDIHLPALKKLVTAAVKERRKTHLPAPKP
ncbi:MAG: hypothetical protein NVS9B14_17830 [Candidatus Acidiferrum sp.]